MFTSTSLQIGDLTEKQMTVVAENMLSLQVNYTMDMASQLSFVVIDPGFEMASNNYFQVGRDLVYETTSIQKVQIAQSPSATGESIVSRMRHIYEISSVSVQQQGSASPQWSVEAMPKAIQQMKRDKKPGSIGGSGYSFVQKAANKYGLKFVGEKSSRIKSASKNSGDGQQDSVWTVITNIAQQSQYVVFVADGYMYFGTQKWLMYKWGTEKIEGKPKLKKGKPIIKNGVPEKYPDKFFIPMEYPPTNERNSRRFEVLSLPNLRKSENDPMAGDGSLLVARDNGVLLRPGMTIRINNVPTMNQFYLITSVTFGEQITDPVSVEFRTPERLEVNGKPAKIPQLPVGKIFQSRYFQPSPKLGVTTVGLPVFNSTTPQFVSVGTTINPVGPQNISRIPNSRRPSTYPTTTAEMNYFKKTHLVGSDIGEAGNIDCYNRPVFVTTSDDSTFCATSVPHIYETVIEGDNVFAIVERLWCNLGVPTVLSTGDAETKYESENLHHGIFGLESNAKEYVRILILVQKEIIKSRFPKSWESIWNGTAKGIGVCGND